MMFRMKLRHNQEVTFHEWDTLKADLMYEYGYDIDDIYKVMDVLLRYGIYRDASAFINKEIDFLEIRVIENEKITDPQYFCETWLLTRDLVNAVYPTLREAIDFARYNHDFLKEQADVEEFDSECNGDETEQMVKDSNGNVVFEITFDGTEKKHF